MKKIFFISIFCIFTLNSFAQETSSEKSDSVNYSVENSAATSIENATETSDIIEATDEKTLEKTTQESPTNQEVVEQNENIETIQDKKTKSTEENLNKKPEVQEAINGANIFKANLLSWQAGATLEQNIHLIICLTILLISTVFLVLGLVRHKRKA